MVSEVIKDSEEKSTDDNNPDQYLFNTYEGKNKGLPYSKPGFASAVQELINKKGILGGDGELYISRHTPYAIQEPWNTQSRVCQ